MLELKDVRSQIDNIDDQLLALFQARMQLVEAVLEYKIKHNINTFDPKREIEMQKRLQSLIEPKYQDYYLDFLKAYVTISKQYQDDLKQAYAKK